MQRAKTATSMVFSHESFSKHNFKQPDAFSKYVKFSISYREPKLWTDLTTAEKNIFQTKISILFPN